MLNLITLMDLDISETIKTYWFLWLKLNISNVFCNAIVVLRLFVLETIRMSLMVYNVFFPTEEGII